MYYDNAFIDSLEKKLTIPGGEPYVKRFVFAMGPELEKNPLKYKTFGVYWWAVKEAFRTYYQKEASWFMGLYEDTLMKQRAWHGSLFRTVLAAAYYHGQQIYTTSDHSWEDINGVIHPYTLYDENAGE